MRADISKGEELILLVDTGADISILKPEKLDKTKQFDPEGRVKVKGVSENTVYVPTCGKTSGHSLRWYTWERFSYPRGRQY